MLDRISLLSRLKAGDLFVISKQIECDFEPGRSRTYLHLGELVCFVGYKQNPRFPYPVLTFKVIAPRGVIKFTCYGQDIGFYIHPP